MSDDLKQKEKIVDIQGNFLIASPVIRATFDRSVVYVWSYGSSGAIGFVINKVNLDISFVNVLQKLHYLEEDNDKNSMANKIKTHFGGPIDNNTGFVIHTDDYLGKDTVLMNQGISITSKPKILKDIYDGTGPERFIFTLGYMSWFDGQLENEIKQGKWLVSKANKDILFHKREEKKYEMAFKDLGISLDRMSSVVGSC